MGLDTLILLLIVVPADNRPNHYVHENRACRLSCALQNLPG